MGRTLWTEANVLYGLLGERSDYLISHPLGSRAIGEFSDIALAL
jgi:hypothetical protein